LLTGVTSITQTTIPIGLRSSDYIRLKNFEIGYTVPESIGKKVGNEQLPGLCQWLEYVYVGEQTWRVRS